MAFPTLNMLSYWRPWPAPSSSSGRSSSTGGAAAGGLDVLPAALGHRRRAGQTLWLLALLFARHLVDAGLGQLHDDDHQDARARHDDVPPAADDLGDVHHRRSCRLFALPVLTGALIMQLIDRMLGTDVLPARRAGRLRAALAERRRRPAAALAAPVLVLLAPGRLHHDPAGDGHGLRHPRPSSPASRSSATSRWSTRSPASPASGFIVWGHHMFQTGMNPRLGTTFMVTTMMIALPSRHQDVQLAGHDLGRQHPLHDADAVRARRSCRCSSSAACRASSWPPRRSTSSSTTPTSSSPTSTTCCSAAPLFGVFARHLLLVSPRCSAG